LLRRFDRLDPAMGHRAADKRDVLHPGKTQIRYKLAPSPHQPVVFLAEETRANALTCHSSLLTPAAAEAFYYSKLGMTNGATPTESAEAVRAAVEWSDLHEL
jgi:hypothetical protein